MQKTVKLFKVQFHGRDNEAGAVKSISEPVYVISSSADEALEVAVSPATRWGMEKLCLTMASVDMVADSYQWNAENRLIVCKEKKEP